MTTQNPPADTASETPETDEAREQVEWSWRNGGFQGFSEEEWLEKLDSLERRLREALADGKLLILALTAMTKRAEAAERRLAESNREEIRKALLPFAKLGYGERTILPYHDLPDDVVIYSDGTNLFTAGDVRAAFRGLKLYYDYRERE